MILTRHWDNDGPRWALDGYYMPRAFKLEMLLQVPAPSVQEVLSCLSTDQEANGHILAPIEPSQEVWASGVTYLRSREARKAESERGDIYDDVYDAERPELFFKAIGWRVVGDGGDVGIRSDSAWNAPEPELVLLINSRMEVVGYTAGNDMSSRDIEGSNPLYLPQAKVYERSCAIGRGIKICPEEEISSIDIRLTIYRGGSCVFDAETNTAQMKRTLRELVDYLSKSMSFPNGVFLMTGTGIVPDEDFTLLEGDEVHVRVGELQLTNRVITIPDRTSLMR